MKFGCITCDAPWTFETRTDAGKKKSPDIHYKVQGDEWIASLPVDQVSSDNCVLVMWTTWPKLQATFPIINNWGFTYKSGFPWLKLSKELVPKIGCGYHVRQCSEIILIATKGSPKAPEPFERMEGVLFSKVGKHSEKPQSIYDFAELYDGPYLEMFSRPMGGLIPTMRENWVQLGNEITGRSMEVDLMAVANDEQLPCIVNKA